MQILTSVANIGNVLPQQIGKLVEIAISLVVTCMKNIHLCSSIQRTRTNRNEISNNDLRLTLGSR